MAHDISNEFKEYPSFLRYFSSRMIQSIVQARMGRMQPHLCSPNPDQADYFNLIIDEIGEIAAYLKSTIGKNYPPNTSSLTVEFILYTADGDALPLEIWVVHLGSNECQDWPSGQSWTGSLRTTFYHQLSTLLRSIIIASRFTPTYRHYVFNQSPETFVITYRVFEGEPDLSQLGDERKYKRLGHLPSPFGVLFVDLYYRTKMEIQPQPFIDEGETAQNIAETPKGNMPLTVTLPQEGSETVAISPISTENVNLFSTSPISQDLPFTNMSPNVNLGRSVSFADEISATRIHSSNGVKLSDPQTSSPHASSSFPQHSLAHNKGRMRNNSFPFASLLLDSQSSSGPALPKVPEHGNGDSISKNIAEETKTSKMQELRRNSLGMDGIGESDTVSTEKNQGERVVFNCGSEGNRSESELKDAEKTEENEDSNKNEENDEEQSSDDSYVKIIAFADAPSGENLGAELSEFVKEVKLAPEALRSFTSEPFSDISKQLDDFREKESTFDRFVTTLHDREEEDESKD